MLASLRILPVLALTAGLLLGCNRPVGQARPFSEDFAWGTGDAAFHGNRVTPEHVSMLQAVGVTHYRFSVDWGRVVADAPAALADYSEQVDLLVSGGITPVVVLHHWSRPALMGAEEGWLTPGMVEAFAFYATTVFDALGDRVPLWITLADPYGESHVNAPSPEATPETPSENGDRLSRAPPFVQARRAARQLSPFQTDLRGLRRRAAEGHQMLMAHALAVEAFRAAGHDGAIGITLGLSPVYPRSADAADLAAAELEDALRNRWYLDPLAGGAYPTEALAVLDYQVPDQAVSYIAGQGTDFIGIDYFAPTRVEADSLSEHAGIHVIPNLDGDKSAFGEADAGALYDLLTRIGSDYPQIPVYITANGAAYGPIDEINENGRIRDELRVRFLRRHLVQAQRAQAEGVDLRGYFLWSAFDGPTFSGDGDFPAGMIALDPATGQRLFKDSARYYRSIIAENAVSRMPF